MLVRSCHIPWTSEHVNIRLGDVLVAEETGKVSNDGFEMIEKGTYTTYPVVLVLLGHQYKDS